LEKNKIYSDEINYEIDLIKDDKNVKMIPLRHLGTPKFYNNLNKLLSKYQASGYTVYYELIKKSDSIDVNMRKFRKITGLKTNLENENQLDYRETLLRKVRKVDPNFDFKLEVIPQPRYDFLIADMSNAKNADITVVDFVSKYENLFGEVVLDSCDFVNSWDENNCKTKEFRGVDKLIIDYRNSKVIEKVLSSENKKILILFGEAHMKGIKNGLLKKGFDLN
jgi:hypothetical protein